MSKKKHSLMSPQDDQDIYADDDEFYQEEDRFSSPYDSDNLNYDKDARWELEENQQIKEIIYQIQTRVNDNGMDDIYSWLRLNTSKSIALTNLDDTIINDFAKSGSNSFNKEALLKMRYWGLKYEDYFTLSHWVRKLLVVYLRRSYKDGERKHRTSRYGGINDNTEPVENAKPAFSLGNPFASKIKKQEQRSYDDLDDGVERI